MPYWDYTKVLELVIISEGRLIWVIVFFKSGLIINVIFIVVILENISFVCSLNNSMDSCGKLNITSDY